MELDALILLPHVRIHNANMISGPLSWGFPAITAFLGAVHRLFLEGNFPIKVTGVGVVCHDFQLQVSGQNIHKLHLCRFPVDKCGKPESIVEEGRIHLDISLVLGVSSEIEMESQESLVATAILMQLQNMRIAGGSVLPCTNHAVWQNLQSTLAEQREEFFHFRNRLLPGFALVERRKKLQEHLDILRETDPNATSIDALVDICSRRREVQHDQNDHTLSTLKIRERHGWFVPIPIGYRAISSVYDPGSVENSRDRDTPFVFVESLYTLGEWKSPHRIESVQELLWHYKTDEKYGLYLCTQTQGVI